MLVILPTWVNLLLKAYAFMGIFGQQGGINAFLGFFGIAPMQILFTDFSFIFVASYIEIPFMILPIFNALDDLDENIVNASKIWEPMIGRPLPRLFFPYRLMGYALVSSRSSFLVSASLC